MKKKYKILTSNEKYGKHHSIEEIAKEILATQKQKQNKKQNKKTKTEQYDDEDSAGMEYIQDMLDNF